LYECQGGSWVKVGYCEPWPVEVTGVWTLTLSVEPDPCHAIAHRTELTLVADGDSPWGDVTITTDDPRITIQEWYVEPGFQISDAHVLFSDDWGTIQTPVIEMDLRFSWDDAIVGTAATSVDGCTIDLEVSGVRMPPQ
jgi:hypothetical protein